MFKFKKLFLVMTCITLSACGGSKHDDVKQPTTVSETIDPVDEQVTSIVKAMSLDEKINYLRQIETNWIHANSTFNIPNVVGRDSPNGIIIAQDTFGVQFPSQKVLASTWDVDLVKEYGARLGYETKASGGQLAIAPSLNMYRTPYGGRSSQFICGEDAFQCSTYAPAIVNAIQSQGILTSVSHFAMNDQEANRQNVNIVVDEDTMREDYLLPFESAVKNADPTGIMCAYTHINGDIACENKFLITNVLKQDWKFKGFVVSDYLALNDAEKAINAGTDLDMGKGLIYTPDTINNLLSSGKITEAQINDSVSRILRAVIRMKTASIVVPPLNKTDGQSLAEKIIEEGSILLKNENNILPLNKGMKIAILGNAANTKPATTFGSAHISPSGYITTYNGLLNASLSKDITYLPAYTPDPTRSKWQYRDDNGTLQNGVLAEYFTSGSTSGTPTVTKVEPSINLRFSTSGLTNTTQEETTLLKDIDISAGNFAARFTTVITPEKTGDYVFKLRSSGTSKLWVNGVKLVDDPFIPSNEVGLTNIHPLSTKLTLTAGKTYNIVMEYQRKATAWSEEKIGGLQGFQASWTPLFPVDDLSNYDAVIVDLKRNSEYEGETMDVPSFDLPEYQQDLIKNIASENQKTIVILHTGGTVNLSEFNDQVKAILFAGHSGEMQGQGIAKLIFGDVSPSGRLPFTIDAAIKNNPTYESYSDPMDYLNVLTRLAKTVINYIEKLNYGYKGYEKDGLKPLYPFGFGLTYTKFSYSDIKVSGTDGDIVVSFNVTNNGNMEAKEVPQVYIEKQNGIKVLKGFTKLDIAPGETKNVEIPLDYNSFAHYSMSDKKWTTEKGSYNIYVGSDINDLNMNTVYNMTKEHITSVQDFNPLPEKIQQMVKVVSGL